MGLVDVRMFPHSVDEVTAPGAGHGLTAYEPRDKYSSDDCYSVLVPDPDGLDAMAQTLTPRMKYSEAFAVVILICTPS